jgi:hypothetical protein
MMRLSGVAVGGAAGVEVGANVGDAIGVTVGLMIGRWVAMGAVVDAVGASGTVGALQAASAVPRATSIAHRIKRELNMRALLVRIGAIIA